MSDSTLIIKYWNNHYLNNSSKEYSSWEPSGIVLEGLKWLSGHCNEVLDFGSGDGYYSVKLIELGLEKCLGIDISDVAINNSNKLKESLGLKSVEFVDGNISELYHYEAASFDGALIFNVINFLNEPEGLRLLKNIHKLLRFRGRVLLKLDKYMDYDDYSPDDTCLIQRNVSYEQIDDLLSPYYLVEKFVEDNDISLYYLRAM